MKHRQALDGKRTRRGRKLSLCRTALLFGYLICSPHVVYAIENTLIKNDNPPELPALPEQQSDGPEYIGIDAHSIAMGRDGSTRTWGARLDDYQGARPFLQIEQGRVVNDKLGVGGTYTIGGGYAEAVVNGIYTPDSDLRLQMTAAHMRSKEHLLGGSNGELPDLAQTAYMFDIQKNWQSGNAFFTAGITLYTANAEHTSQALTKSGINSSGRHGSGGLGQNSAMGTLGGYMLNLAFQPTRRTDVRLHYRQESVTYRSSGQSITGSGDSSGNIRYTQSFDDCSQIDGSLSKSPGSQQMDLRYEKGSWSVSLLRTRTDGQSDTSVQVGYTIPLGASTEKTAKCDEAPVAAPNFEPIIDTTTARPQHLPKEPLTAADTNAM